MTDKEFEIIKNSIKIMTPEQYEKYFFCLNGKITKEIVETVLREIDKMSFIDDSTAYILGRDFEDCFQDLYESSRKHSDLQSL